MYNVHFFAFFRYFYDVKCTGLYECYFSRQSMADSSTVKLKLLRSDVDSCFHCSAFFVSIWV